MRILSILLSVFFYVAVSAQSSTITFECPDNLTFTFSQNGTENGCPCYEGLGPAETGELEPFVLLLAPLNGSSGYGWFPLNGTCDNYSPINASFPIFTTPVHECDIRRATPTPDNPCRLVDTIPTLSEWGLIMLGLSLMIFGAVAVREKVFKLA